MILGVVYIALLATGASASYDGNLNYLSPSTEHPALGIDVPKVMKRNLEKRDGTSWDPASLNFTHGVASGDPYPDSVILWTRVAPMMENDDSNVTVSGTVPFYSHETERYIKTSSNPICLDWRVASDDAFEAVVSKGQAYTTSDIDYTVKVEATKLQPFTTYYYQFTICRSSNSSPVGRTKTAPAEDDSSTPIGLAVYSCSNFPNGYFNAYGNGARKDHVDYVVHLGDYIYEYEMGVPGRDARATNPPREIITLYDYRTRIAQYRTDLDLRLSHQQFPWIPVWDDHEVANNGYRDGFSGMNNTEESFIEFGGVSVDQRKMNAVRAYFEWMPIRQVALDDNLRIWRSFKMGKMFDLIMLDTRNYDRSITTLNWNDDYIYDISNDAARSLMGGPQENWFYRTLIESKNRGAVWRIIGNQIVFSRINVTSWFGTFENPYNGDQWDGYMANRNRTYQVMYDHEIDNNIMLAGDSHANWVSDLVWFDEADYDPVTGAGAVGVEFAGTAVSSTGFGGTIATANNQSTYLVNDNSELQWNEGYYRGYFELQVSAEKIDARYFGCPTVATRNPLEISLANFTVQAGANRLQRPVAGGSAESGYLQGGDIVPTNLTYNTETGEYSYTSFDQMFIEYPDDDE
ncbi:uncharacterized protein Z518_03480 [Rhinocladiella mackenziei CBS 650.93]|uniref:Alkaline phosphatase n=1 Tax=Rhinocladiella mackenziei CBS 650.93 TaxID=1442369 RepID=A0A0D2HE29_9EURO|nr:uncharacterized protein Z518_03480 [Rhinocladiella mackenziei CBS 650.93]KIX08823.1 hypothetical protein Z518_03480 [Rhinocladiella mackenziei CBS 650.93]